MAEIKIARGLTLVYEWEPATPEPQHVWLMFDSSNGKHDGLNLTSPHTKPPVRLWARDRILEHLATLADRARDVIPPGSQS